MHARLSRSVPRFFKCVPHELLTIAGHLRWPEVECQLVDLPGELERQLVAVVHPRAGITATGYASGGDMKRWAFLTLRDIATPTTDDTRFPKDYPSNRPLAPGAASCRAPREIASFKRPGASASQPNIRRCLVGRNIPRTSFGTISGLSVPGDAFRCGFVSIFGSYEIQRTCKNSDSIRV